MIAKVCKFIRINWKSITATGAVVGFLVTTLIQWNSFEETLNLTREIARVEMINSIHNEFSENNEFRSIENSIVYREKLYSGSNNDLGGKYNWRQINDYLGFFEKIGYLERKNIISIDDVDFFFGSHIVEACLDGDIRDYVVGLRGSGGQGAAFVEFQRIAEKLIDNPSRKPHVDTYSEGFRKW